MTTICPTCDGRKQVICRNCGGGCDMDYRCWTCSSRGSEPCEMCGATGCIEHPIEDVRRIARHSLGEPIVNLSGDRERLIVRYRPMQKAGSTILREGTFPSAESAITYIRKVEMLLHKEAKESHHERRLVGAA